MCAACVTPRPEASSKPTEQSRLSLMLVEKEERTSTLPISSAIEESRLAKTSIATGSARWLSEIGAERLSMLGSLQMHDQISVLIDDGVCCLGHYHGGAHFFDDGGALYDGSNRQ